jgi:hypothetical protein
MAEFARFVCLPGRTNPAQPLQKSDSDAFYEDAWSPPGK